MTDVSQQLIAVLLSLLSLLQGANSTPVHAENTEPAVVMAKTAADFTMPGIPSVPFYSQFSDITDPAWKKVGCGITGLAMLIDYYEPAVSVDTLLEEGIDAGAYLDSVGWSYAGLIGVSQKHGLTGRTFDYKNGDMETAFAKLEASLTEGPVMASVYYTLTPGNPIPHLIVVNGIKDGIVYYNDPANLSGGDTISVEKFKPAWKKRFIEFRPTT